MALDIGGLTIGFSSEGMNQYKNNLKLKVLDTTIDILKNTQKIEEALDLGWEGQSKDKFKSQLKETIGIIEKDLKDEYSDIEARFADLYNYYMTQDENLLNS